jgi:outer membrane protein assembly factor BamB
VNRSAAVVLAVVLVVGCSSSGVATPSPKLHASTPSPAISAEWTEYHLNASRSGLGPATPALSTPRVAWSVGLDGDVYASPLVVGGHVIAATENNTVYSLDLFTGSTVWKIRLGDPVDASSLPCGNIKPITGITGTPAADPTKGRLYVVAFLRGFHHMLFALSLADGSVVWQQDIDPPGSSPTVQQQRGALALGSGLVYVPLGGLWGDCGQYHGYVVAVPSTGGQSFLYRVPSPREAGIWTPAGPTIDPDGNVYVVTGNGASRSTFDYSDSVVELTPDLQQVRSYFAPPNWLALSASDTDLGSVGATVIPSLGVVMVIGKDGVAYLLKADRLGGIGGQITSRAVCPAAFGGTAWSGTTVFVPCTDGLYALSLTASSISVMWHTLHPALGSPIVTAGAVWGVEPSSGNLYAVNPSTGEQLYSTPLGGAQHFGTPAATEGFVVVPAGRSIAAITTAA